jgi:hypothetical protein
MLTATRRVVAALREPARAARLARMLWLAWAVIVWNVVFDHVIVVAGRNYILAASLAVARSARFARMDEWMRPAVTRGFWIASAAAAAIAVAGLASIHFAVRTHAEAQVNSCA